MAETGLAAQFARFRVPLIEPEAAPNALFRIGRLRKKLDGLAGQHLPSGISSAPEDHLAETSHVARRRKQSGVAAHAAHQSSQFIVHIPLHRSASEDIVGLGRQAVPLIAVLQRIVISVRAVQFGEQFPRQFVEGPTGNAFDDHLQQQKIRIAVQVTAATGRLIIPHDLSEDQRIDRRIDIQVVGRLPPAGPRSRTKVSRIVSDLPGHVIVFADLMRIGGRPFTAEHASAGGIAHQRRIKNLRAQSRSVRQQLPQRNPSDRRSRQFGQVTPDGFHNFQFTLIVQPHHGESRRKHLGT